MFKADRSLVVPTGLNDGGGGARGEPDLNAGPCDASLMSRESGGAARDERSPLATSHDTRDEGPCALTNDTARNSFVVRRLCVEAESARRSRITLQQLESWKNLRVDAWRERIALLHSGERSVSLQSSSAAVEDGCDSQSARSPLVRGVLSASSSCRGPHGLLLENYYDAEVARAARRYERRERAAHEAEALRQLQRAHRAALASNKDALDSLRMRERQVEMLAADVQRLTAEKKEFQWQHRLLETQQQQRIEELEQQCEAVTRKEASTANRVQGVLSELERAQRASDEKEKALHDVRSALQLMEKRVEECDQQLRAAAATIEEERRRASELSTQHASAQEMAEGLQMELQRCRDEGARALKDQATRYEAMFRANELATEAAARQMQADIAALRQRCKELQQERETERAAIHEEAGVQRQEAKQLHDTLHELQQKYEAEAAELAACRQQLQEEIGRNDEAERLLRLADVEISKGLESLAKVQSERDEERRRCEQLEATLRVAKKQSWRGRCDDDGDDVTTLRPSLLRREKTTNTNSLSRLPSDVVSQHSFSLSALTTGNGLQSVEPQTSRCVSFAGAVGRMDECLDTRLQALEAKVEVALGALLDAKEHTPPPWRQRRESRPVVASLSSTVGSEAPQEAKRNVAAECVVKLRDAMAVLDDVLKNMGSISLRSATGAARCEREKFVGRLQQHWRVLNLLLEEISDVERPARPSVSSVSILMQDPLIETLLTALVERLCLLLEWLREGGSSRTTVSYDRGDGFVSALTNCDADLPASPLPHPPRTDNVSSAVTSNVAAATCQLHKNGGCGNVLPCHTFGFVGGRLEVSNNGRRLRRLLLPKVVDLMSSSALGSLDHRTFLEAQNSSTPSCFEFTIRLGEHCDGLLVGLADRYLQLEGFSTAQSSMRYTNCYYLHVGRGTLYCPVQGMTDVPYRGFWRAAASSFVGETASNGDGNGGSRDAALRMGEEISCSLDTVARTIRFLRNGIDCGVAFEHVSLTRALFPAFEVNSRGCTVEFV